MGKEIYPLVTLFFVNQDGILLRINLYIVGTYTSLRAYLSSLPQKLILLTNYIDSVEQFSGLK